MALTEIKTSGIADDAVTADKLANAINTERTANTAKATNATHSGDVTGSGSLTIADNAVTLAKMAGGTDGQIITYDASGDPVTVGPGTDGQVLTSTGAGSPPAFEDAASGVGGATGVDFNDNVKARFGTGNDLEVYHDGSNSRILENGTGYLRVSSNGTGVFIDTSGGESMIDCLNDGAVSIYYNNSKKFETTNTGTNVTGVHVDDGATHDGDVSFNGASYNAWWDKSDSSFKVDDYAKIKVGTGGDLQIFHDTNDSYIRDSGTGDLYIDSNKLKVNNAASNETMAIFNSDGAVELNYDNSKKLETASYGVAIAGHCDVNGGDVVIEDNQKLRCGNGDDLQLYHNGTYSYITNSTGYLEFRSGDYIWDSSDGSETYMKAMGDGAVELYYDGTKKLETTSSGINLSGRLVMPDSDGSETNMIRLGGGADLKLYHDGSNSYIVEGGTGNLRIRAQHLQIQGANAENMIYGNKDGSVELYHNAVKKFETIASGTITSGHSYLLDNNKVILGSSDDFEMFFNGTNTVLAHTANTGAILLQAAPSESSIRCNASGSVDLYYDNSKKLETRSAGVNTIGNHYVTDNNFFGCGDGADLTTYHNGTDSYIRNQTGILKIQADDIRFFDYGGNESLAKFVKDGACELYFNDSKKLETTTEGTKVNGIFRADGSGAFTDTSADKHAVRVTGANWTFDVVNSHASNPYGINVKFTGSSPDDRSARFFQGNDTSTGRIIIYSDGDIENHDGSYGQTSDVKLKENIVDASSQWDDVKAVKVRNFNFKINKSKKLIGVVAQELETISPGLVNDNPDIDENGKDLGTTTKSVKSSILYMKAFKALQEAMAKIEALETKVAALEAK